MRFKLSNLTSNLALTLGYLKPALNNSAQDSKNNNDRLTGASSLVQIPEVFAKVNSTRFPFRV